MYNIQYNNSRNNNIIIIKSDNIAAKGSSSSWRCRCRCRCRCRVVAAAVAVSFLTAPKQYGDFVARVVMAGPGVGSPPPQCCICLSCCRVSQVWFYSLICGWWLLSNCFTFAFRIGDALRYTRQQSCCSFI